MCRVTVDFFFHLCCSVHVHAFLCVCMLLAQTTIDATIGYSRLHTDFSAAPTEVKVDGICVALMMSRQSSYF